MNKKATIEDVRSFWNEHPLYEGESKVSPGELSFFLQHEKMTISEHSGRIDPIFTKGINPSTRVLDVGCGIGFWMQQLSKFGAQITACDVADSAINLSQKRLELFNLEADIKLGNAEDLPYDENTFDHLNCQGVIHHTPSPLKCIEEFHRVLKPNGILCFSVYYKTWFLSSKLAFGIITSVMRPFIHFSGRGRESLLDAQSPEDLVRMYDGIDNPLGIAFTKHELLQMLNNKFVVLEEKRFGFPRRVFPIHLPNSIHRILSRYFGLMIVLRCQKVPAPE